MTPMLLAYPGEGVLGDRLQQCCAADRVDFELRRFPDGESYVRIDSEVRGRTIVVLCTLRDPDPRVLPLIFLADTLCELGAAAVGLVAPYLAYMRQDQRFRAGEALTSASFSRLVSQHFDWLITVDPHLHRRKSLAEIYSIPTAVVHAAPLLANWVRANVQSPVLVGPDVESEQWVSAVAAAIPCPHLVLHKIRHGDRSVTVSKVPEIRHWTNHTPVLVDDIIASGRTMAEAARQWKAAAGRPPVCLGVHGLFVAGGYESLLEAGATRIVTTNSVTHVSNAIDLSAALAASVLEILRNT